MRKRQLYKILLIFLVAAFLFISFAASYGDDEISLDVACDGIFLSKYNQIVEDLLYFKRITIKKGSAKSVLKQVILYIERNEKSPPEVI